MGPEHKCNKATEIERIDKALFGNGKKGLIEVVTILDNNVLHLSEQMKQFNFTVNELMLYKSENEGYRKANAKNKATTRWAIGLSVASLLTVIGLILKK